jgi:hypothetical protein
MPKRIPRPRDPVQLGKPIGVILTGQVEDQAPSNAVDPNKDPAAVALGRKGGLKGGRAQSSCSIMPTRMSGVNCGGLS